MKKCILRFALLAIAVSILSESHGQYSRLKNSQSSQVGIGFSDAGLMVNGYYIKTFDQTIRAQFGGGLIFGNFSDVNYKSIFLDGIGSYTFSGNKLVSLNALAGISFVGDYINTFPSEEYDKQFSFNYGFLGGLEAEFVATRKLSFILSGTQRYYIKRDFGRFRYQAGVAIRVTF